MMQRQVKTLLKLYDKTTFCDFYEIVPGIPPTIEVRKLINQSDMKSIQNQINKLKSRAPNILISQFLTKS